MLVEEFSRYLKINKSKKYNSSVILLEKWLQLKLEMPGRVLLKALYNFCEYYDNYQKAKQNNM